MGGVETFREHCNDLWLEFGQSLETEINVSCFLGLKPFFGLTCGAVVFSLCSGGTVCL